MSAVMRNTAELQRITEKIKFLWGCCQPMVEPTYSRYHPTAADVLLSVRKEGTLLCLLADLSFFGS